MPEPDPAAELCRDLADLYRALGAAIAPDVPDAPDRSNVMRPALLWCTVHRESHRRNQWRAAVCEAGQDPRRASVLVAPALAATAPKWSQARKAYGPSAPFNLDLPDTANALAAAAVEIARTAREELGDVTRDTDPEAALANLPMLLGRLGDGHPVRVRALGRPADGDRPAREGALAGLRRRARVALGLASRPRELDPCPADQQPYAASWEVAEVDGRWVWVPDEMWADGVCRTYDEEASRPDEDPPVFVWRRSKLYVRDASAGVESDDAAIRCRGCGLVWRGLRGRIELNRLMRPELPERDDAELEDSTP